MNTGTAKLINEARVKELLDCYGADAEGWPQEERASAVTLIKHSADLRRYQQEAKRLDDAMQIPQEKQNLDSRPGSDLVTSIINALPEQDRGNAVKLSDHFRTKQATAPKWWSYTALAAAAVLVLAVTFVMEQAIEQSKPTQPTQPLVAAKVSRDDLHQWLWEQATGPSDDDEQDFSQNDSDGPATFMAMVDLESSTGQNYVCRGLPVTEGC